MSRLKPLLLSLAVLATVPMLMGAFQKNLAKQYFMGGLTLGVAAPFSLTPIAPPTCDHVSHNHASAVALTGNSAMAVVANSGDSCKLPAVAAGLTYMFCDGDSSHTAQLFGPGTTTINGVATDTGITVSPGCVWCLSDGSNWACSKN